MSSFVPDYETFPLEMWNFYVAPRPLMRDYDVIVLMRFLMMFVTLLLF